LLSVISEKKEESYSPANTAINEAIVTAQELSRKGKVRNLSGLDRDLKKKETTLPPNLQKGEGKIGSAHNLLMHWHRDDGPLGSRELITLLSIGGGGKKRR